jgi:mRNA deadenylase 3'-5' endonuclease subunit Ccr4
MLFTVATYNVLASAYAHNARYPRTPATVLASAGRVPALAQYISSLNADILCLQEVEPEVLAALGARLGPRNYAQRYARRTGGQPDGCATFFRYGVFGCSEEQLISFADGDNGQADTGNIALVTILGSADRRIGIINTHLTWDPPGTPLATQRAYRQSGQLLATYEKMAASADAWIVAGDFNVTPESEIVEMMKRASFEYAHSGYSGMNTCTFNGESKMIDYLFYSAPLRCQPREITRIDGSTILPSAQQPSDHVAVVANFD